MRSYVHTMKHTEMNLDLRISDESPLILGKMMLLSIHFVSKVSSEFVSSGRADLMIGGRLRPHSRRMLALP